MWFSSCRTVTAPQAAGIPASRWAIVSSSPSSPARTRLSATAPLNALATLAIRMWSVARGGRRRLDVGGPARSTVSLPSR